MWTQAEAIELCRKIEAVCPPCGCHVALTGGTLYGHGARKDCDLIFYRIRQFPEIDYTALWGALGALGVVAGKDFGWCKKATYGGKRIDCLFPEITVGGYPEWPRITMKLIRSPPSGCET